MEINRIMLAGIAAAVMTLPARAHHSHGNYDVTTWMPFEGTVQEVHLVNPHSWIYLEVDEGDGDGAPPPGVWALEATNPGGLERNGIGLEDVRPGDTIRVRCHRLRDGSNGCLLGYVTPLHGDAERGHGVEKEWD